MSRLVMPFTLSMCAHPGVPLSPYTTLFRSTSFQAGASAAFGAGITVTSTTVVSSTQLSVALVIGATAAMGARDVSEANTDELPAVLPRVFGVLPPQPTLGLAFLGKLRATVG